MVKMCIWAQSLSSKKTHTVFSGAQERCYILSMDNLSPELGLENSCFIQKDTATVSEVVWKGIVAL